MNIKKRTDIISSIDFKDINKKTEPIYSSYRLAVNDLFENILYDFQTLKQLDQIKVQSKI